ncbi:pectinesterase inhibitor-like [Wolffia australiana]
MGRSQIPLFPLAVALSLFFFFFFSVRAEEQLLCSKTPFPELCAKTLTEPVTTGADLKGKASAAVQAAAASGAATSAYLAARLAGHVDDPLLHQCLSDCADEYVDAVEELEDAAAVVAGGGYADVAARLSAAAADADTCRGACGKAIGGVEAAALVERNEEFARLTANALAVVNLLPSV